MNVINFYRTCILNHDCVGIGLKQNHDIPTFLKYCGLGSSMYLLFESPYIYRAHLVVYLGLQTVVE